MSLSPGAILERASRFSGWDLSTADERSASRSSGSAARPYPDQRQRSAKQQTRRPAAPASLSILRPPRRAPFRLRTQPVNPSAAWISRPSQARASSNSRARGSLTNRTSTLVPSSERASASRVSATRYSYLLSRSRTRPPITQRRKNRRYSLPVPRGGAGRRRRRAAGCSTF